ncbi:hypothetical protein LLG96_06610 [bacterium]|nr:hypothetical protein [bacterium]
MNKRMFVKQIILFEITAYSIIIFMFFADEIFDLPHYLLGAPATPINWTESYMESGFVTVLAVITIVQSYLRFR